VEGLYLNLTWYCVSLSVRKIRTSVSFCSEPRISTEVARLWVAEGGVVPGVADLWTSRVVGVNLRYRCFFNPSFLPLFDAGGGLIAC